MNSGTKDRTNWSGIVGAILVVGMILAIPIGLLFFAAPPAEPYAVVPGDPMPTAVANAGAHICSTTPNQWDVPGATGGTTYVISYDCANQSRANTITVQIQAFDSQDSRDAVMRIYNTMMLGRGKPLGNLMAYNQYLIFVTPPNTPLMSRIGAELQAMRAAGV